MDRNKGGGVDVICSPLYKNRGGVDVICSPLYKNSLFGKQAHLKCTNSHIMQQNISVMHGVQKLQIPGKPHILHKIKQSVKQAQMHSICSHMYATEHISNCSYGVQELYPCGTQEL